MAHPMTPPPKPPYRFLESSPSFSDYYTESSPSTSSEDHVVQRQLLRRLDSFRKQIASVEPNSKNAKILDAQLDGIEVALNAPETQTREPTDLEDSGLFLSDDEDEELKAYVDRIKSVVSHGVYANAWDVLAHFKSKKEKENQELREIAERFSHICIDLQKRSQEIKHVNELLEHKLVVTNQQNMHFDSLTQSLRSENQALREDLQLTGSEMVFLKLQLDGIEKEAAAFLPAGVLDYSFDRAIKLWKLDWDDVNDRYHDRKEANTPASRQKRTIFSTHGKSHSVSDNLRPAAERTMSFPLTSSTVRTITAYPPSTPAEPCQNGKTKHDDSTKVKTPAVSRWKAFWDALADAAGITNYDELLHEDS